MAQDWADGRASARCFQPTGRGRLDRRCGRGLRGGGGRDRGCRLGEKWYWFGRLAVPAIRGRMVAGVVARDVRGWMLYDFGESFECSCESDERQSKAVWGNFA